MGAVGKVQKPTFSIDTPGFGAIFRYGAKDRDKQEVADWLTNLGRPLKKNEFSLKSVWVGSRLQGGLGYGYKVIFPEGKHNIFGGLDNYGTQADARYSIRKFVDAYNDWYKQNGGK